MPTIERHLTRDVLGLESTSTCRDAARLMAEHRIGAAVVRDGSRVVGLVTERDLVVRVLANGCDCDTSIVRAMRTDLPVVTPTTGDEDCANLMRDHHTRHLLVTEGDRVIGIISMRDVIRLMIDEKQSLIDQLQEYIAVR
jgi:CBS domain-containing protein